MFVDIMLFASYSLIGKGYILFEPALHADISSIFAQVWNILHMPVNIIFGPLLFPYFDPYNWSLSYIFYILLCFLQLFLVGLFIGMIFRKIQLKAS